MEKNKPDISTDILRQNDFEKAPEAIEILNSDYVIVDCNEARLKLTGHKRSEVIGKHISDFFISSDKNNSGSSASLEAVDEAEGEYEILAKDNRIIPIRRKTKAVYDNKKKLIGIINYLRQIESFTKRSKKNIDIRDEVLSAMVDNALKYQALFENSKDAIFILTKDMFVDCNKAALDLFAGSREQVLNASLINFIPDHTDDKVRIVKIIEEKIAQTFKGIPQSFELELCRFDKKCIHAEINLSFFVIEQQTYVQAIIHDITEQYLHKKAIQKSEALFKGVIYAAQDAIIGIDQKGLCFLFNPAAEKMFLRKEEDVLGKNLNCLMPEKYKTGHNNGVKNIIQSGDYEKLAEKIYKVDGLRSNGEEFPLEFSFSPVTIAEETFIIASGRDITKRVNRINALKESERKFRQLFHDMPDAIFVVAMDKGETGKILDVNLAAEQQSGYSRKELLQMNILSQLCADDRNRFFIEERERRLLSDGRVQFTEKKIHKNGSEYWTDVILTKISYNNQNAILGINRDITEKIFAEEKIVKLSAAFEQSPVFFMITDSQGKIEYVNKWAHDIIGHSPQELIGQYFRHKNFPDFPKEEFAHLWRAIKSGKYWRSEFKIVRNNRNLYVSAGVFPIKNERGEIINYLGVIENRTDQQRLREQLFQIQKMDSIGALTGGIAHDFNNLLTVINGYSELAISIVAKNDALYNYIKAIYKAGERSSRLVGKLLAFTRQQVIDPKVIDLNTTIEELNKMIIRLIGTDIQFETVLGTDIPPIKADPVQIEQILINLIVNARDAINEAGMDTSYRRIEIATKNIYSAAPFISKHPELEEGNYVLCMVSDSGTGIPKEIIDRIFEPFFTTKEKGRGTGLGLSTVYGIVRQNKGDIQVYSVPGKGTTFKIYWPATDFSLMKKKFGKKTLHKAADNEHILLVDDDEEVRNLAKEMLTSLNYRVTDVGSGNEALEVLQSNSCSPQLLITDLVMPEMDGMELAQKVKRIQSQIKILYASGFADDRFIKRDRKGMKKYFIQKPYTLYTMADKIREVLETTN